MLMTSWLLAGRMAGGVKVGGLGVTSVAVRQPRIICLFQGM